MFRHRLKSSGKFVAWEDCKLEDYFVSLKAIAVSFIVDVGGDCPGSPGFARSCSLPVVGFAGSCSLPVVGLLGSHCTCFTVFCSLGI
jgi:hypothetical protein